LFQNEKANEKFLFENEPDVVRVISPVNPVEDFRKMVGNKKEDLVEEAIK
jgi:hypothetical protein